MKNANPFPYSRDNKRYRTYDCFMREKFGGKCIKVSIDGGFTCPNIDGTRGRGGCVYCSKKHLPGVGLSVSRQFEIEVEPLLKKWGHEMAEPRFIPYFRVFTGTYAPTEKLRALYEEALALPGVVGLSIATRADCISDETAELLRELDRRTFLTVELGLQTVHDTTAARINRGHSFEDFVSGYEKLRGLNICVHLINGLPGEDADMMIESARTVGLMHPHALKLHMLYIERGTEIARDYEAGAFELPTLEQYADIVVRQLEVIPAETVIGRITGDGEGDALIAPMWSKKKFVVMNEIDKLMRSRDTWQGKCFGNIS